MTDRAMPTISPIRHQSRRPGRLARRARPQRRRAARCLAEHDLADADAAADRRRCASGWRRKAGARLRGRVLARQVRADQRDLLRRHRPARAAGDAGPHHDVPGRAGWDARRAAALALLPIETRLRGPVARRIARQRATLAPVAAGPRRPPSRCAQALQAGHAHRAGSARTGARARLLERRRRPTTTRRVDDDGQRRGAGVAPCADQLSAPAAQAGPGGPRHAGPERDRRRARADAGPAADARTRRCSSSAPTPA